MQCSVMWRVCCGPLDGSYLTSTIPRWVVANLGRRTLTRSPDFSAVTNEIVDGRLKSTIEYSGGTTEAMDFELFEPEDLVRKAKQSGLDLLEACCWWDENRSPDPLEQRYQLILGRR
jgi:hypothetical protein